MVSVLQSTSRTRVINLPISANGHGINPVDTRIAYEQGIGAVRWVEEADSVLLHVSVINEAVCIGLHAVGDTSLTVVVDRCLGHNLGGDAVVTKTSLQFG